MQFDHICKMILYYQETYIFDDDEIYHQFEEIKFSYSDPLSHGAVSPPGEESKASNAESFWYSSKTSHLNNNHQVIFLPFPLDTPKNN